MAMMTPGGPPIAERPATRFLRQGFRRPPAAPGVFSAPPGRPMEGAQQPRVMSDPASMRLLARARGGDDRSIRGPQLGSDVSPPQLQPAPAAGMGDSGRPPMMMDPSQAGSFAPPVNPDGAPMADDEELKRKLMGQAGPMAPSAPY